MSALTTVTPITVPFHDIDSMGIAWHGNYARYLEVARCELLDRVGYGYREMAASPWSWPVIDMRIRYAQPLVFGQQIQVQARLLEWSLRVRIGYEIRDAQTQRRLTRAHTVQVAANRDGGLLLGVPLEFQDRVEQALAAFD